MNETKINESATDEELIGVLTAISVVSKHLARNLIQLEQQRKSMRGEEKYGQDKRDTADYHRTAGYCFIIK